MKEMFKSKTIIAFLLIAICIGLLGGQDTKKDSSHANEMSQIKIINK